MMLDDLLTFQLLCHQDWFIDFTTKLVTINQVYVKLVLYH